MKKSLESSHGVSAAWMYLSYDFTASTLLSLGLPHIFTKCISMELSAFCSKLKVWSTKEKGKEKREKGKNGKREKGRGKKWEEGKGKPSPNMFLHMWNK